MLTTQREKKQNYKIIMWNEAKTLHIVSWSLVPCPWFLVKKKMIIVKLL